MASGNGPAMRVKAKRKDGSPIKTKDRDGKSITVPRADVFVVWDNEGKYGVKCADKRIMDAIEEVCGGEVYLDLYDNREDNGQQTAGKSPAARKAAASADADF